MTTQNDKLSQLVTPDTLDKMYRNFVKISSWVAHGQQSKYPMPKGLADLYDTVKTLSDTQTTMQSRLAELDALISALHTTIDNINVNLAKFATDAPTGAAYKKSAQTKQPEALQTDDALIDLDAGAAAGESPNEQAILVSAEAVDAGNLDPASYAALDAEIDSLLVS